MRRLALIAAAALVAGCYGSPAGSASPASTVTAIPSAASATASASASPSGAADRCKFPHTVSVLDDSGYGLPKEEVLACLGRSDVKVTGWLAGPWNMRRNPNGVAPAWLGEWLGVGRILWLKPHPANDEICYASAGCVWMFLHSSNPSALPLSPDRWVTVTGHYDDPAAATCRWTDPGQGESWPMTPAEAVAYCRTHFVVTAIENAAPAGQSPMP